MKLKSTGGATARGRPPRGEEGEKSALLQKTKGNTELQLEQTERRTYIGKFIADYSIF